MSVYVSEYAAELKSLGSVDFSLRYAKPVIVVKGVAGNLKDPAGKRGGTMITEDVLDQMRQASLLVGRVFMLTKGSGANPGPITIGRTAANDVCIPEYSISQRHCVIKVEPGGMSLTDAGSTNGTFVNGTRLAAQKPLLLVDGIEVTLGRFVFVYYTNAGFRKMLALDPAYTAK